MNPAYMDRAAEVSKAQGVAQDVISKQNQGAKLRAAEMGLDYVPDQGNIIGQAGLLAGAANRAGMTVDRENTGIFNKAAQFNAQQALRNKALEMSGSGGGSGGGGVIRAGGRTSKERAADRHGKYGGSPRVGGRGIDSMLQRDDFRYNEAAEAEGRDTRDVFGSGRGSTRRAPGITNATSYAGFDSFGRGSETDRNYSAGVLTGGDAKTAFNKRRSDQEYTQWEQDFFGDLWGNGENDNV
jgi:hypothetical protein